MNAGYGYSGPYPNTEYSSNVDHHVKPDESIDSSLFSSPADESPPIFQSHDDGRNYEESQDESRGGLFFPGSSNNKNENDGSRTTVGKLVQDIFKVDDSIFNGDTFPSLSSPASASSTSSFSQTNFDLPTGSSSTSSFKKKRANT